MHIVPLTLVFSSCYLLARAGTGTHGQNCTVYHNRLEVATLQFWSDCDAQNYCSSQGICEPKGCRKDQYPFGYDQSDDLPPKCPAGQFCPDEGDACLPVLSVGSPCQLNRDDQCEGPPNWSELVDNSNYGLNVNGSVCLNDVCMWANVTVGQTCVVDNTAYIVYSSSSEFIDIVSRDNCLAGLYCDGTQLICMQTKDLGETCAGDKECASYNCNENGVCARRSDIPNEFAIWVYIAAGCGIFGGMFFTLVGMFWLHRHQRDAEREKRLQYWREQHSFRESIHQMQETVRTSMLSLSENSVRNTMHSCASSSAVSEDSSRPTLQRAGTKPSGLRHYIAEEDE